MQEVNSIKNVQTYRKKRKTLGKKGKMISRVRSAISRDLFMHYSSLRTITDTLKLDVNPSMVGAVLGRSTAFASRNHYVVHG